VTPRDANEHVICGENAASFEIDDAHLRDLRAVAAIQRASFRPGLAYGMFPLVTLKILPFVTFLVARKSKTGEIIGCIIGDRYRGDVRIMNIAVHPDWRRQGVATALLRALDERLPGGNMVLMVEENNHGAQALYQEDGFTRSGYQRNYYGSHRHGIEMTHHRQPPGAARNGKPTSRRIRV
jgi:ribosomal protein S18 acetylase RimI-like enzyme